MNKRDISVVNLVDMIYRKELQLPAMQRRYVWTAARVRDLLDSLYRGYPSGAILVWETDDLAPTRAFAIDQQASSSVQQKLLLDGQQRLTSLFAVLRGEPLIVRGEKKPIELLFNLDHPDSLGEKTEVYEQQDSHDSEGEGSGCEDDERGQSPLTIQEQMRDKTFVVSSKGMTGLGNWVSVTEVLKSTHDEKFLKRAGITSFDDPRYRKYQQRITRLRSIREYPYVMHVLERTLSYEEVAEIFVRVNSQGVNLKSSDLALAQITARWPDLLPELEAYQEGCARNKFDIDQSILLRTMVIFASGHCRFNRIGSISTQTLQDAWIRAQKALNFSINFLRANGGIDDLRVLSSPFFIPAVAYAVECAGGSISEADQRTLLEWVLVGSGRGYFGGSSESKLDADLARLRRNDGPKSLLERVRQIFGRIRFDSSDIAGRNQKSGIYGLCYLALKHQGAKDWRSGIRISWKHTGTTHALHSHHIFPKARLAGLYDQREINEIANRAFIEGGSNQWFGKKLPKDYLPDIISSQSEVVLTSQCVPLNESLWQLETFPLFLENRREKLANCVNALLDQL